MPTRIAGFVYTLSTGLAVSGATVTPRASDGSAGATGVTNSAGFVAIAGLEDKTWFGTVANAGQVFVPALETFVSDDIHNQASTLSAHGWSQIREKPSAFEAPVLGIRIPLKKALPAATNNATLDDDWVYKSPWTNEAVRISAWYIRFESNLAANATFELRKNGTAISGASITVNSSSRDAAIDTFTETILADGDSLEVWQTAGNAEDIGGSAFIYGDQDVPLGGVSY